MRCSSAGSSSSRSAIACRRCGSEARISADGSKYGDVVSGGGEQISDAVAHQSAADDADFLFAYGHAFFLTRCGEPRFAPDVISRMFEWPIRRGEMVMPALLWVAFWSSMMAAAACFGDEPRPVDLPADPPKQRDPRQARRLTRNPTRHRHIIYIFPVQQPECFAGAGVRAEAQSGCRRRTPPVSIRAFCPADQRQAHIAGANRHYGPSGHEIRRHLGRRYRPHPQRRAPRQARGRRRP